jgi:hypothetical protein
MCDHGLNERGLCAHGSDVHVVLGVAVRVRRGWRSRSVAQLTRHALVSWAFAPQRAVNTVDFEATETTREQLLSSEAEQFVGFQVRGLESFERVNRLLWVNIARASRERGMGMRAVEEKSARVGSWRHGTVCSLERVACAPGPARTRTSL